MLRACVLRFNVTGTMQTFLGTKQSLTEKFQPWKYSLIPMSPDQWHQHKQRTRMHATVTRKKMDWFAAHTAHTIPILQLLSIS